MRIFRILLIDSSEGTFLHTNELINRIPTHSFSLELSWIADYEQAGKMLPENNHDLYLISPPANAVSTDGQATAHEHALSFIEQVQKQGCCNPIILLVENAQGMDEVQVALNADRNQSGIVDYLVKDSYTADTLLRSIRYCLTHARQAQQITTLTAELDKRMEQGNQSLLDALKQLKKSNDELREQVREKQAMELSLQESFAMLTTIAENFPNGVISVLDQKFNFIYINGRELEVWGLKKEDFTGKNLSDFLSAEQYELLTQKLRKAFSGNSFTMEYQGSERSGHQIYLLTVVPIIRANKQVEYILVVTENITERKLAEEEMHKAIEKEKELNVLKTKFVSMASHEFRTPLSTIASSVNLIDKYNELTGDEKIKKHIIRIKSAIHNLTSILDEFLSLSKLEEGKVDITPGTVHLPVFIVEIIDELFYGLKEGQEIHYVASGHEQSLVTDKQLLKNVLFNLLTNASKYSAAGKQIHVKSHIADHTCTIQVQDQGIGIPAADQAHLFDQFFRAGNVAQEEGTGLGLAIVKRYLALLGGKIDFESHENQGTVFTVTLPAEIPH